MLAGMKKVVKAMSHQVLKAIGKLIPLPHIVEPKIFVFE
jgi:hypothetical protein